jgi:hypothetical protein
MAIGELEANNQLQPPIVLLTYRHGNSISFVFPFQLHFLLFSFSLSFFMPQKLICRNFPTKSNARVIDEAKRSRHLPHQQVKKNYFNSLNGFAASFGNFGSGNTFTNLLKTNFLNNSLDQTQLAHIHNTHTQNLLLSDQFSRTTTSVAGKSRAHYPIPAGLSVAAALNINLSALGPLGGYIGASHSKEPNSSNRVSRAASPALGSSAENNRLNWITNIFDFKFLISSSWFMQFHTWCYFSHIAFFYCFRSFPCFLKLIDNAKKISIIKKVETH